MDKSGNAFERWAFRCVGGMLLMYGLGGFLTGRVTVLGKNSPVVPQPALVMDRPLDAYLISVVYFLFGAAIIYSTRLIKKPDKEEQSQKREWPHLKKQSNKKKAIKKKHRKR